MFFEDFLKTLTNLFKSMRFILICFLIFLNGCLGEASVQTNPPGAQGSSTVEPLPTSITEYALTRDDLGFEWVQSAENLSADIFERRFVRVEDTFGGASRIVNRIHLYPDSESALADFSLIEEHLRSQLPSPSVGVGEGAVMWTQDNQGYLLFIRGSIIVELEYSSSAVAEPDFLIAQGKKVDDKIAS